MSTILSILLLLQLGMTCGDVKVADNVGNTTNIQTEQGHHHDGASSGLDDCSPFCVCHCCHTHIIISNQSIGISVAILQGQQKVDYYRDFYLTGLIYSIWRPPQFS